VDPVVVSTVVGRPREEVFEYLADVANHSEFMDHFTMDWHLTREESYGKGAGARFKVDMHLHPGGRFAWGDITFATVDAPGRIVARGRFGKFGRTRTLTTWELEPEGARSTRVEVSYETEPGILSDRINEMLGARRFWRRKLRRALSRLARILEEDRGRGVRTTIAGGARKPASAYRFE
jgi:uncharacterized protein YndB with AHSA1/START domain